MIIDLQKLYSPSQWSKRLRPDEIIEIHGTVMLNNSNKSRELCKYMTFDSKTLEPIESTANDNENVLQIFYKDSNSFSISKSVTNEIELNFHGRKIFIYLHGGYWQWGSVYSSSFMAANFVAKDIIVIAIGYPLCPNTTMTNLVNDVENSMAKLFRYAHDSPVYVCGHSAGAHLAAMLFYTDFKKRYGLSQKNLINGYILASGVFDLQPLLETSENENLKMSVDESRFLSPMFKKAQVDDNANQTKCNMLVVYGNYESPAFIDQSIKYAKLIEDVSNVQLVAYDCDHFDLIERISDDKFELTQKIYEFMEIDQRV